MLPYPMPTSCNSVSFKWAIAFLDDFVQAPRINTDDFTAVTTLKAVFLVLFVHGKDQLGLVHGSDQSRFEFQVGEQVAPLLVVEE